MIEVIGKITIVAKLAEKYKQTFTKLISVGNKAPAIGRVIKRMDSPLNSVFMTSLSAISSQSILTIINPDMLSNITIMGRIKGERNGIKKNSWFSNKTVKHKII